MNVGFDCETRFISIHLIYIYLDIIKTKNQQLIIFLISYISTNQLLIKFFIQLIKINDEN
jgi:hypothetical protein